eukprot:scaffold55808_cov63-Phaeocystis_antarctica.AAC.3
MPRHNRAPTSCVPMCSCARWHDEVNPNPSPSPSLSPNPNPSPNFNPNPNPNPDPSPNPNQVQSRGALSPLSCMRNATPTWSTLRPSNPTPSPNPDRYPNANANANQVHPSPVGHQLLGAMAARFVAKRLADAACEHRAGGNAAHHNAHHHAYHHPPPPPPPPSRAVTVAAAVAGSAVPSTRLWEQCFTVADQMPVWLSGSWRLVDEGGLSKGVRKLGYLSTAVGDTLRIGPLRGPATRPCALLRVTLGYQLSAARTDLGAASISCSGC